MTGSCKIIDPAENFRLIGQGNCVNLYLFGEVLKCPPPPRPLNPLVLDEMLSEGDLASVLINELPPPPAVAGGVVARPGGLLPPAAGAANEDDFFSLGGDDFAASDSELVTMGLPWAACCLTFARRFLNHT